MPHAPPAPSYDDRLRRTNAAVSALEARLDALEERLDGLTAIVGRLGGVPGGPPVLHHTVFGPPERLSIAGSAVVNDALFNTVSGSIVVEDDAFFGHGVCVLTGSHDVRARGADRKDAIPASGRDVRIGPGAWVASRAVVLGPCTVGADAVVAAGAVVSGDVPARTVVGGVPARVLRRL
jgi:acetyltransferase-like isoleucine patch superfamily enzyme